LSEDEQRAAEDLIRQIKVSELLVATLTSWVQLGYAKLADGEAEDARLAIEALRTLLPVLEGSAPADSIRDLRQATANLQLAYADHVVKQREPAQSEPAAPPEREPEPEPEPDAPPKEEE
jgi:hypothetical protein